MAKQELKRLISSWKCLLSRVGEKSTLTSKVRTARERVRTGGKETPPAIPPVQELEQELKRERYRVNYLKTLRSTIYTLITVAAVSVLVAVLFLPVLQIYGTSMTPTLSSGDIVVSVANPKLERGEIVAFYYNNKILVKRVIAVAGEWVDIDEDGTVYVNSEPLDEPYLTEKAFGDCNIDLPYQVPEGKIFVMGDHRSVSVDSRNTSVGCVAEEEIVGELIFRAWPFTEIGAIH